MVAAGTRQTSPRVACVPARHAGSRIADPSTVENRLWRVRFASVTITYTYTYT